MYNFFKKCATGTLGIIGVIFTIIPESVFESIKLCPTLSVGKNTIINRVIVIIVTFVIYTLISAFRKSIIIKGKNYCINIKYEDIFKMHDCKKIIPFDECFTTSVGPKPSDINPTSICGQYLTSNPIQDIQSLINSAQLKPSKSKSKYNNMDRYDSGKLVPNGDYLLLSFAKLNKDGIGEMTREEYLDCLSLLWKEIDKHYGQNDVCIPILGSGVTRIDGVSLSQQELLDMIIESYKLTTHKIKLPNKLYIVCKKQDDFSLNKIGENI